jgi:predicted MPP superfamily phosphohydrolase
MKKLPLLFIFFINISAAYAAGSFSFALITDLHIDAHNPQPAEYLQQVVAELNANADIAFVLVSGDVTERGDSASLQQARSMLQQLKAPYYITPGNHDTYTGGLNVFYKILGSGKFCFTYGGFAFAGFPTVPQSRELEAHILPADTAWLKAELDKLPVNTPVLAVTHYPLQAGDVDNWYDMTQVLRRYNTQAVLCGHYHRNAMFSFGGVAGIVNRSVLRGRDGKSGYTIFKTDNNINVYEKITGEPERLLFALPVEIKTYDNE